MLSHREYMDSKNTARFSYRCISLCKHLKVSFSLYILTALDILQGGPLVRGLGGGRGRQKGGVI